MSSAQAQQRPPGGRSRARSKKPPRLARGGSRPMGRGGAVGAGQSSEAAVPPRFESGGVEGGAGGGWVPGAFRRRRRRPGMAERLVRGRGERGPRGGGPWTLWLGGEEGSGAVSRRWDALFSSVRCYGRAGPSVPRCAAVGARCQPSAAAAPLLSGCTAGPALGAEAFRGRVRVSWRCRACRSCSASCEPVSGARGLRLIGPL